MPIKITWANGTDEEIKGEDFSQDGSFLRILGTRLDSGPVTPTIRLIPMDRFIVVRREDHVLNGYAKRKDLESED